MMPKFHLPLRIAIFAGLIGLAACTSRSSPLPLQVMDARCDTRVAVCNVLAGSPGNSISIGVNGATIAGGGRPGTPNRVSGDLGTVSGGEANRAGEGSTVAGGSGNSALYFNAAVGGGSGNLARAEEATVSGGLKNTASGRFSSVGGGGTNQASADFSGVSGGSGNTADGQFAYIGGGTVNAATNVAGVVAGGEHNQALGAYSASLAGINNTASGAGSLVGGGAGNTAGGLYALVPGGFANQAGGDYSFAAGRNANVSAKDPGSFLFADSNNFPFLSLAPNEFGVRASGGVRFVTAIDPGGNALAGVRLSPGSGSWENLSDAQAKTAFAALDGQQVLERLMSLQVSSWSYRGQGTSIRHIGPMAQDFYNAFQVGDDAHYISTVDEEGVALAAIQQLYRLIQEQQAQASTPAPAGDSGLSAQIASLHRQLIFSNGLAGAALVVAVVALWKRSERIHHR